MTISYISLLIDNLVSIFLMVKFNLTFKRTSLFGPLVLSQSSKEFAPKQSVGKGNVTIMAIVSKTWRDRAGKLTIKSIGYNNF